MTKLTGHSSSRLRWGRVVGGGFLLELLLILALVPPLQMLGPEKVVPFVYPAVFIIGFAVAWWLLRKVPNREIVHGTWIGVIATAIYLLLCVANPEGIQSVIDIYGLPGFILGNLLRILGCAAGGYAVHQAQSRRPNS
jgi:hypothetical protein